MVVVVVVVVAVVVLVVVAVVVVHLTAASSSLYLLLLTWYIHALDGKQILHKFQVASSRNRGPRLCYQKNLHELRLAGNGLFRAPPPCQISSFVFPGPPPFPIGGVGPGLFALCLLTCPPLSTSSFIPLGPPTPYAVPVPARHPYLLQTLLFLHPRSPDTTLRGSMDLLLVIGLDSCLWYICRLTPRLYVVAVLT